MRATTSYELANAAHSAATAHRCTPSTLPMLCRYETTSTALAYTLFELARNPEVLAKLLKEVDTFGRSVEPGFDNLKQFPYTEAVFSEAMRMHPPVTPLFALVGTACEASRALSAACTLVSACLCSRLTQPLIACCCGQVVTCLSELRQTCGICELTAGCYVVSQRARICRQFGSSTLHRRGRSGPCFACNMRKPIHCAQNPLVNVGPTGPCRSLKACHDGFLVVLSGSVRC